MRLFLIKESTMKKIISPILLSAVLFLLFPSGSSAQFSDFFKKLKNNILGSQTSTSLSEGRIVEGLKEALKIGTDKAIDTLSKKGGFFNNPEIKIMLPAPVKKVEGIAKNVGLGSYFDSLERSMNAAAEQATPMAKGILLNALKNMSITDAKKILTGRDNEATLYFKEKTFDQLMNLFKPAVHSAMSKTGVIKTYQDIETKIKAIPYIDALPVNFSLDDYVSENALNGIFLMIEKEEKKIREDPAARITDLLKDVFGRK